MLPISPDSRNSSPEIQAVTTIKVEVQVEATQPDQGENRANSSNIKTRDQFSLRRVLSNNKSHPIVTVYNSKVEPPTAKISFPSEVRGVCVPSFDKPEIRSAKSVQRFNYLRKFSSFDKPETRSAKSVQRFSYLTKF